MSNYIIFWKYNNIVLPLGNIKFYNKFLKKKKKFYNKKDEKKKNITYGQKVGK